MRQSVRGRATTTITGIHVVEDMKFASSPRWERSKTDKNGTVDRNVSLTLADSDQPIPLVSSNATTISGPGTSILIRRLGGDRVDDCWQPYCGEELGKRLTVYIVTASHQGNPAHTWSFHCTDLLFILQAAHV